MFDQFKEIGTHLPVPVKTIQKLIIEQTSGVSILFFCCEIIRLTNFTANITQLLHCIYGGNRKINICQRNTNFLCII